MVCHNCSKICHPNFVTWLNVHESEEKISVIQNHSVHGSLVDFVMKNDPFCESRSRIAVKELLLTLKFLEIVGLEIVSFGLHSLKVNERKTLTIDDLNMRRTKKREIPREYLTLWFISGILLDDKIKVVSFNLFVLKYIILLIKFFLVKQNC